LDRLLGRLEEGDFRAAVITGKPFVFAAGADITEFPDITRERAVEGARAGHELFGRLRALPFPTVAAINGACLGGGVELALHCTARTISTAVRHFAFPEVFLGLFPAWGGTNHVLERMHDAFPERFPLSPALAAMAHGGEPVALEDAPRTEEQIVEEVLEAVADEIHLLLDEGVVAEAADVDTGLLLGAGWPFFLGGITKHLDQSGVSERLFGHTFADMTAVAPA
jgi:enoyl-CoA hydratase/carnithine racemase